MARAPAKAADDDDRLAPLQADTLPGVLEPAENPILHGHETQLSQLRQAHVDNKLHHALLFAGSRGVGKATAAFHLARALLGEGGAAEIASPLFRMVASGAHPGVLHLTRPWDDKAKRFKTQIIVEELRRVNRFLGHTAHDGGWRIVIVDPADDMNRNAANALLKNLEEPPKRTLFILITHQLGRLLPTIRSRCQLVRFQPLPDGALAAVLGAAGEAASAANPDLRAAAHGSARSALLIARHDGLRIARSIDQILGAASFSASAAAKLADTVAGRDGEIEFSIFNDALQEVVARRATAGGMPAEADRFASLWQESERAIDETLTWNLDKRQHVMGRLRAVHEALAGPSARRDGNRERHGLEHR